ncbi:hypothetical protein [Floricoccus penangensis]|uniref:hypothetical protein n=1 Tax=Floricoccus penangensis TaxID=1859475 RepID=UPI00203F4233|nr:hypothetical protein [Floricoccus penangensis]URZ87628.1 hypothetical protein KIW23_00845 [Floricoccus penangensis]
MEKYILSRISNAKNFKNTAAIKPKMDQINFLKKKDFKELSFDLTNSKLGKAIYSTFNFRKYFKDLKEGDLVIYQYPSFSHIIDIKASKFLSDKKVKKAVLIHDVESLRHKKNDLNFKSWEIDYFNSFDYIISHNELMSKYLIDSGVNVKIINLEIFDNFTDGVFPEREAELPILFAGNLAKSQFLNKIEINKSVNILGPNNSEAYPENITYKGSFPPEELSKHLNGSYGLVWDGNRIDSCSGVMGEYLKFNNPHKVSMYLSLGIPVIIWSKAALANFVEQNKVGLIIDKLSDIDDVLDNTTIDEYNELKKNSELISKKIRSGYYIDSAVEKILNDLS